LAYFAAGRNSFLDGGVFLYALDPQTGRVVHQRRMYGPYDAEGYPIIASQLASGFGLEGLKADVFLAAGDLVYLRHQAFRADLSPLGAEEPRPPHLIPSPGFLEAIPHHRTFWTIDTTIRYDIAASRGIAHGDILVLDGPKFYEVRGYPPGRAASFDPRPSGYTLFAGEYSAPAGPSAAAGEAGPAGPAALPKPAKRAGAGRGARARPKPPARIGVSKGPGPKAVERWSTPLPLTGKAMVLAGDTLFVAGTPVEFPADDLAKAYEGRMGGVLWAASAATGGKIAQVRLDAPPAWDAMAVAGGRLFIALQDGRVLCLGGP
jgi:hypothetical protein